MLRATAPSTLLLLAACTGATSPPDSAADGAWWAKVEPRLQAEDEAFFPAGDAYVATLPALGLRARFDADGVVFSGATDPVRVAVTAWGRADDLAAADGITPTLGGCSVRTDVAGDCLPRLEYADGAITTWWESTSGGFEQGWDIASRPAGTGALRIELATDAEVRPADDGLWLVGADGRGVHVGELAAWDAAGVELGARVIPTVDGFAVEVDDDGAVWPITVDPIYTTAATTITGSSASDGLGFSVNGAGDVNHDSYADLVVGAPGYSSQTGRVYVFHGSAAGVSTTATTTITGPSSGSAFGTSVAGAGDVDGDNYGDIVVGAPQYDSYKGTAYVYYGTSSGITTSGADQITTSGTNLLGFSVDGAGDVDNDGYDDFIIGQPYYNTYAGRARVYYGKSGGFDSTPTTLTVSTAYGVGYSVSAAGDVNKDGYADVVVGAPWYGTSYGSVFVFHGSASGTSSSAATSIYGTSSGAYLGAAVGGGGDVNNDTYDDVVVGAYGYSSNTGRVTVYQGSSSGVSSTAATTITGSSGQALGASVAVVGDTDGDGYDEIMVGAPYTSSNTGAAYLYAGSASGIGTTASISLSGSASSNYYGTSVNAAGDVNKDGFADVTVGAYGYDSSKGRAYVYLGYSPDSDGDGWSDALDCNDSNPAINPGATEICDVSDTDEDCDGVADDSDSSVTGKSTFYKDTDADGYGGTSTRAACDLPSGYTATSTDCNDSNSAINPGATELCDASNTDEDCDGLTDNGDSSASAATKTTFYQDTDADGYGSSTSGAYCDLPSGYAIATGDCNDGTSAISPGASEICDASNTDEDCDGAADDADSSVSAASKTISRYADADADGYGTTLPTLFCDEPTSGYATVSGDCNDSSAAINPAATEVCDAANTDEDCDGGADDGDASATGKTDFYKDADGDLYGAGTAVTACDPSSGYVATSGDCNDIVSGINPGAAEVCDAANVDEDCDGSADDSDSSATGKTTFYQDSDGDSFGGTTTGSACDASSGWVATSTDCNDSNASISPAATEVCDASDTDEDCDGVADNADSSAAAAGKTAFYADSDVDGYGGIVPTYACDLASGYTTTNTDCNDAVAAINPGATEVCDAANTDEDCDGLADNGDPSATGLSSYYRDLDGDTFGAGTALSACDPSGGYVSNDTDCDDTDGTINPASVEICDPADVDEDCDGAADDVDGSAADATKVTLYVDADTDGYGGTTTVLRCDLATGYVATSTDCDDSKASVHPGGTEICDAANTDEDCDGAADDLDSSAAVATKTAYYRDGDGDTYGGTTSVRYCDQPTGYYTTGDDCDDADATVHPGASEVVADGIDQDCDGAESCYADADADGFRTEDVVASTNTSCADAGEALATARAGDCDDTDPAYNPGATESDCADPNDYNCDGAVGFTDGDGDGYAACEECDDHDAAINPAGQELCDDTNLDEDCDGLVDDADDTVAADGKTSFYVDGDADGFGGATTAERCDLGAGYTTTSDDCDDTQATVNPAALEVCDATDTDEDCDGLVNDADPSVDPSSGLDFYEDGDADGYGGAITHRGCSLPEGHAATSDDCDDVDPAINPGASEVCDTLDNDCDTLIDDADDSLDPSTAGTWYADADADGYGDALTTIGACAAPEGYLADATDCDDADATVYPGGAELPADTVDGNCDGLEDCYVDGDGDGYHAGVTELTDDLACETGTHVTADVPDGDCDDTDADFHPSAPEDCDTTIDYNCDGSVGFVDGDADGWAACEECDDGDATINPDATEVCDTRDNNCDGSIDGADAEGAVTWFPDVDDDGYTAADESVTACDAPIGYGPATATADCNDDDATVNPSATEGLDDGVDQDCDGVETCLTDADEDGFRPDDTTPTESDDMDCDDAGEGSWADPGDDCDDDNASAYPGAEDVPYDGIDQDCDGVDAEDGFPGDTGEKPERVGGLYGGGGCGCTTGGAGGGAGLLVALAGLLIRRR